MLQGSLLGLVLLNELEKGTSNDTAKFSDDIKFFYLKWSPAKTRQNLIVDLTPEE